ncbi:hypothetical protein M1614_01825 [Candidatus Marsarchaeota archaeon]|nr:hypothetical protein [Candidatus Marsarchaeota archaeon]
MQTIIYEISFIVFDIFTISVLYIIISFGVNIKRNKIFNKYSGMVALLIIFAAVIFVWYAYFPNHIFIPVLDDEEFLSVNAISALFSGSNPYVMNIGSKELYDSMYVSNSITGYTLTTNNTIVGVMAYPPMFFLSMVPFYIVTHYFLETTPQAGFAYALGVFLFVLFLLIAYFIDRKFLMKPNYVIVLILIFGFFVISASVDVLMFILLLIAYVKIESKYSFILLGLAASFQELLWVPVILFLVYILNNKGLKKGSFAVIGTIAVFFAISGYFIFLSPSAYFNAVFKPLNSNILPNIWGPFGYALLNFYPIQLQSFSLLFYFAVGASVILILYTNKKQLIGLLSVFPLAFLYRGVSDYYLFFITFTLITLFMYNENDDVNYNSRLLFKKSRMRKILLVFLALIVVLAAFYIIFEHNAYVNETDVNVYNGILENYNKSTYYSATLSYNFTKPTNIYVMAFAFNGIIPVSYGLVEDVILENLTAPNYNFTNYSSIVNPNKMMLYGNGKRNISIIIKNVTLTNIKCVIYNNNLYYFCQNTNIK